jgi:hypothetical protein
MDGVAFAGFMIEGASSFHGGNHSFHGGNHSFHGGNQALAGSACERDASFVMKKSEAGK